jgi:hypothetical protein
MTLATSVVIVALATMASVAQSRPSFAGKWTLTSERPSWGLGPDFTATQDDKAFTVVRNPGGHTATYRLDGSNSPNTTSIGGKNVEVLSKLKWDGAKLVLTATYSAQGFDVSVTQTWSLDASGALTVDLDYVQGAERSASKSTYKKG